MSKITKRTVLDGLGEERLIIIKPKIILLGHCRTVFIGEESTHTGQDQILSSIRPFDE